MAKSTSGNGNTPHKDRDKNQEKEFSSALINTYSKANTIMAKETDKESFKYSVSKIYPFM
jgi:hypothetical protein